MSDKEASDKIEVALQSVLPEQEGYEEGDIIVEWALIAYVTNPDSEKLSGYPLLYSNGELATHRAIGLFQTALNKLG